MLQPPPGPRALRNMLAACPTEVPQDPSSGKAGSLSLLLLRGFCYSTGAGRRVSHTQASTSGRRGSAATYWMLPRRWRQRSAWLQNDDAQRRVKRAVALAHLQEFSAARAALIAMPMAPASLGKFSGPMRLGREGDLVRIPAPGSTRITPPAPNLSAQSATLLGRRE